MTHASSKSEDLRVVQGIRKFALEGGEVSIGGVT
jgi:hypothetical protein